MIAVTELAKQELKRLLNANVDNPQARLRLTAKSDDQLGLDVDIETPGDETVEYEGAAILVVEKELSDKLEGITLDVDDTPEGPQLVIVAQS